MTAHAGHGTYQCKHGIVKMRCRCAGNEKIIIIPCKCVVECAHCGSSLHDTNEHDNHPDAHH